MDLVTTERDDAIAIITFNLPERRNAWSEAMHVAYLDALEAADRDINTKAIVVTGKGDCFSAGADFKRLRSISENGWVPYRDPRPTHYPLKLATPLIAAINGPAVGMGLVNAMYCDFRIAAETSFLNAGFARLGLVAEHGLSWLVPHMVGLSVAMELLLSGRPMTAGRACDVGLVMSVEESAEQTLHAAVALGKELSGLSTKALAATKTQLIRHMTAGFDDAMAETQTIMRRSLEGSDFREGLAALLEKRPAAFPADSANQYVHDLQNHL